MLVWQKNVPRFVAKEFVGDKMTFFFGSTNLDDIEIAEFHFVIQLFEHDGVWSIYTEWHQWSERTQKPKVEVFLSELNRALKARTDFDFRKYWYGWSHEDSHFSVVIRNKIEDAKRVY
jgi:hypothetical protein